MCVSRTVYASSSPSPDDHRHRSAPPVTRSSPSSSVPSPRFPYPASASLGRRAGICRDGSRESRVDANDRRSPRTDAAYYVCRATRDSVCGVPVRTTFRRRCVPNRRVLVFASRRQLRPEEGVSVTNTNGKLGDVQSGAGQWGWVESEVWPYGSLKLKSR